MVCVAVTQVDWPINAGLDVALAVLEPVKSRFSSGLSYVRFGSCMHGEYLVHYSKRVIAVDTTLSVYAVTHAGGGYIGCAKH